MFHIASMDGFVGLFLLFLVFARSLTSVRAQTLDSSAPNCTYYSRTRQYCYLLATDPNGSAKVADWSTALNHCRSTQKTISVGGTVSVGRGSLVGVYDSDVTSTIEQLLQSVDQKDPVWIGAQQENSASLTGAYQSLWRWVQLCPECNITTACTGGPLDLVFLLDTSGSSVSPVRWIRVLQLISGLLNNVKIGSAAVRVAIVDGSGVVFNLNQFTSKAQINSALGTLIQHPGSSVSFSDALNLITSSVFIGVTTGDRLDVPNVVVALTTNNATQVDEDLLAAVQRIRNAGIKMFALSVANTIDESVLKMITATPAPGVKNNTYFMATSYDALNSTSMIDGVLNRICLFHRTYLATLRKSTYSQGCMLDWGSSRDMTYVSSSVEGAVTPLSCMTDCSQKGYSFGATQNGDTCYCGNQFGRYDTSDSCTVPCIANRSQYCGGFNRNAIYRNGTFVNWSDKQPNNLNGYQWCGAMDQLNNSTFDDQYCQFDYRYICQLPPSNCTPSSQQPSQSSAYVVLAGMCLYISSVQDTWFRARQSCLAMGGELLVINSENIRQNVALMLAAQNVIDRYIWIGLYRVNYIWNDEIGGGTEMGYNRFSLRQPMQSDGISALQCVYMNPRYAYQWYTSDCSEQRRFVCQYKFSATPVATTPAWMIGLLVLMCLLLVGIIILVVLMVIAARSTRNEANGAKSLDVRPKAPEPQTGPILPHFMESVG